MNANRDLGIGLIGMFFQDGLYIDKIDHENKKFYFNIPKDSYSYHEENEANIKDAESYANRIKQMLIEVGVISGDWKCLYKIRDEIWTKEMGKENFEKNKGILVDLFV